MPELIANTVPALEAGVCDRLKAKVEGVAIEAFPDNPQTYRLLHPGGALLVQYGGADYDPPGDTEYVVQRREMLFNVHVVTRSLSGHQGAYVKVEAVRQALAGHRIPGFTKMRMRRERFVARQEGLWIYAVTVAASTTSVELQDDEEEVLLQRATLLGNYGNSEVPIEQQ